MERLEVQIMQVIDKYSLSGRIFNIAGSWMMQELANAYNSFVAVSAKNLFQAFTGWEIARVALSCFRNEINSESF
jgi:hypothetical protein